MFCCKILANFGCFSSCSRYDSHQSVKASASSWSIPSAGLCTHLWAQRRTCASSFGAGTATKGPAVMLPNCKSMCGLQPRGQQGCPNPLEQAEDTEEGEAEVHGTHTRAPRAPEIRRPRPSPGGRGALALPAWEVTWDAVSPFSAQEGSASSDDPHEGRSPSPSLQSHLSWQ